MKKTTVYKTLDELKMDIIDRLNNPSCSPLNVTRAHEAMFGNLIPHSVGKEAPEGKYKVVLTVPLT